MTARMIFTGGILMAILAVNTAVDVPSRTAADQSLMKYMMNSRFSSNPSTTKKCFDYYMPILNDIVVEFERSFQQCSVTADDQIDKLNEEALKDRYEIELAADGVCTRMETCNNCDNSLDFFDCYSGQGSNNSKILYVITQNSTEKAAELHEQYRTVKMYESKCQNASERAYVEDTTKTYTELDICLKTGEISSTVAPETTTPTTTTRTESTSTTKEPETTTTVPPENEPQEDPSNGRGLKILPELRRFWRIK